MKRNCIVHARIKQRWNGKLNKCRYEDVGITASPIEDIKKENLKSTGGVTIAVIKKEDGTLSWGFAKCNEMDSYNRRVGRDIAIGRAEKKGIITKDIDFKKVRDVSLVLAHDILSLESADNVKLTKINPTSIETLF